MNTKRQTVWLVSMLSLMVVLSAYYLFTDDVDSMNTLSESELNQIVNESLEGTNTELLGTSGDDGFAVAEDGTEDASGSTDEEIIAEYEADSSAMNAEDFFAAQQMERDASLEKQIEELLTVVNESDEPVAVQEAMAQISTLQDQDEKITYLEGLLMNDYPNAMITEEDGKFRIAVQAAAMEKTEAVSIAELVMAELDIAPSQVVIQLVQE